MQEVAVSRTIDASREAVLELLSPAAIVEYAGTYEVGDVRRTDDGWVVTGHAPDLEAVLVFEGTENGFRYRQRDDRGPFEEMDATVSVAGDGPVEVTARSRFTFGLPLARLTDWLARRERRTELRRLVDGIEAAVEERDETSSAEPRP